MTAGLPGRLVVGFADERSRGAIAAQVRAVAEDRIIRVVDLVVIRKTLDGDAIVTRVTDRADDPFGSLARLIAAPSDGQARDDVAAALGDIPDGTAALVVVFEHRWADGLAALAVEPGSPGG